MKLMKVVSLFGVALVPHIASAATQLPAEFGQTKAIYDYCSKIDPADAATFGRMWSFAVADNASLPQADGFQEIYASTMARLEALPRLTMVSGCHGGASEWTDTKHRKDDDRQ